MPEDISSPSHFESHISLSTDHSADNSTVDSEDDSSDAQYTALDILASHTQLSKLKLKRAMTNGSVWLENGNSINRLRRAKKVLQEGDSLHLYYDEAIQSTKPDAAELIADEGAYSIWNKPYGMYSQGSKWGDHCTIYRWAEQQLQRPSFLVHRLDRAANGLIIIAHSKKTAAAFARLFKDREIQKRYRVIVEGQLDASITLPHTIETLIDDKPAISKIISFENIEGDRCVIEVEIETGRKHQIRKHMAELGHPVIGDRLYGSARLDDDLQLQSRYLKFKCPVTGETREYSL